ncbi:protein FAM83A-like [Platichthys flesus]|uniref:protein FAM83A-like n=1 Tax=Platichthys flesus TaxID=8260 RepID=UPI002DB948D2|nr:protein FAM83A-like [Platichthys flesus]
MDTSSVSALWYRRSKPQGKLRRRVQDLRIPSSCYSDFIAVRPVLDLSHNESVRLAVDSLLSLGLQGYQEVLKAEGEADFLSELEKDYILRNGKEGNAASPGESDGDDDTVLEGLSTGSQSATQCPAVATGHGQGLGQRSVRAGVRDEPNAEVYFQSDGRGGAGMKDLVREFIRKATLALAIVMDSFTDVELLCDLLEASRKRNVSVHLLLDHSSLNLFVTMWQDLKLNSKDFPKLSVRSVDGQTYCAKTGRKLTGQVAESFIITDWTEALAGSYSFSWLSWQVHRSLAVLVKGSEVTPFHQEFHRLYSSSKPVPGFVTFISESLPLFITSHATQNDNTDKNISKSRQANTVCHWVLTGDASKTKTTEKMTLLSNSKSPECNRGDNLPLQQAVTGTQTHSKPPALYPEHLGNPCRKTHEEPLEKNRNQLQGHSETIGQTQVSYFQSQSAGLTITSAAGRNAKVQQSGLFHAGNPTHRQQRNSTYQCTLMENSNLDRDNPVTGGLLAQQRNRNRLTRPSGTTAGPSTQTAQWNFSPNPKQKMEHKSDNPKLQSPPTSQQKQAKTDPQFLLNLSRGHTSGTRRQYQHQSQHQPPNHSHQPPEPTRSKFTLITAGNRLQTHPDLLSPGTGAKLNLQPHASQQEKPPPRLNWLLQIHTARPRPVARTSSFDTTYWTGQKRVGQPGWRPAPADMNALLRRSRSLTERRTSGLKGTGLDPNMTRT